MERNGKPILFPTQCIAYGNRLYELRCDKKYTQEHFSELSGIPRTNLSLIEHGKMNIQFDTMMIIANTLQISPGEFMHCGDLLLLVELPPKPKPSTHFILPIIATWLLQVGSCIPEIC